MNGMKLPLALIMAIAVQAGGLLWYVSKIDSKVEVMYTQFEKSNQKAVIENQVRMHIDLQNVVEGLVFTSTQIEQLTQMVENVRKTNAQLIRQNEKIKNTITNLKKQITELKKGNQKKKKKKDGDKELG
jgi:predicted RNase H-like nuclease (RuvC/YqgF family)